MITQQYYRPELDVLRLIAFLSVFFTHRMDLAPIDATRYFPRMLKIRKFNVVLVSPNKSAGLEVSSIFNKEITFIGEKNCSCAINIEFK